MLFDSQIDSQSLFESVDPELLRIIKAWGNLPPALKTAVIAIIKSSDF